ncbi:MFS transporter (plasmid) [Streptomyces sp. BI20]|uniref:MFS transporter n=1 Tax=Streptomyces sp. BI20 TaxID=3403460 RepID=UPI003C709D0C
MTPTPPPRRHPPTAAAAPADPVGSVDRADGADAATVADSTEPVAPVVPAAPVAPGAPRRPAGAGPGRAGGRRAGGRRGAGRGAGSAGERERGRRGALGVLARPPIRGLLALAFLARTTSAVLPLTLLLALADAHGYARAATVAGGHTLVLALCAPLRGRLLDRLGARRALTGLGAACAVLLALVAVSVNAPWPWWTTLPLAVSATLAVPPLNVALRASWRRLAPDAEAAKVVHSADSLAEEAGFVSAPLAAGGLVLLLGPRHAYACAAAVFLLVLLRYLRVAHRHGLGARPTTAVATATTAARPPVVRRPLAQRLFGPLATPGVPAILPPLLVMGCVFGGAAVLVPARVQHEGAEIWLGPLLAALSVGGVVGGLVYAAVPWRADPWRRHRLLTLGFALPTALFVLARPLWALGLLLFLAGLTVTPLFVNAFLLVDATADDAGRHEATTWIGAAPDLAHGIMAAVVGSLVHSQRWDTALTLLSGCALAGALATLAVRAPASAGGARP